MDCCLGERVCCVNVAFIVNKPESVVEGSAHHVEEVLKLQAVRDDHVAEDVVGEDFDILNVVLRM